MNEPFFKPGGLWVLATVVLFIFAMFWYWELLQWVDANYSGWAVIAVGVGVFLIGYIIDRRDSGPR